MQHNALAAYGHPLASSTPKELLSFFLRPKVTRSLNNDISIEIENVQESPGLFYARFHDRNGSDCLPANLSCVNLATSTYVQSVKDRFKRPVFLVVDTSWYAFCQGQSILAYIHGCGVVLLPNEVRPHPTITEMDLLTVPGGLSSWSYGFNM